MTVEVVVMAAALIVAVSAFQMIVRQQAREHARERQLLVNQILHLTGHTWQPPPADTKPHLTVVPDEPIELVHPSQLPD